MNDYIAKFRDDYQKCSLKSRKSSERTCYRILKARKPNTFTSRQIKSRSDLTDREREMLDLIEKAIGRKLLDDEKFNCGRISVEAFDDFDTFRRYWRSRIDE